MRRRIAIIFGILGASGYLAAIIFSGAGWNPAGIKWNFSNPGAFGDAFGPLNSIMAGVAAVSAYLAYKSQSEELGRVKADAESERIARDRRDFENTFFNLLQLFRAAVQEIEVKDNYGQNPLDGREALKRILEEKIGSTRGSSREDSEIFKKVYAQNRDKLAHYFRLFYNILRFVREGNVENKFTYTRLLRATLSNAEIVLIALNCIYGGGKEKLRPLVEHYAMLHNISASDAKSWRILNSFDKSAFGDRTIGGDADEF